MLSEVVGALVVGKLSDKLGRRNLFMVTLGTYLVGSGLTTAINSERSSARHVARGHRPAVEQLQADGPRLPCRSQDHDPGEHREVLIRSASTDRTTLRRVVLSARPTTPRRHRR